MGGTATHYEEMPDGVREFHGIHYEKDHPQTVGKTSDDEPKNTGHGQPIPYLRGCHHNQPTHQKIEKGHRFGEARVENDLHGKTGDGESPNDPEKPPAQFTAKRAQHKRGVAARNQNENAAVIEHSENPLGGRVPSAVVQTGNGIKQNQAGAKNAGPEDFPHSAIPNGFQDEDDQSDHAQKSPETVAEAVGRFF